MPIPTPEPRAELLALLDAVKDHPDDDTPRLVLADWLDEQDNPLDAERAKFIRKDIAKHRAAGYSSAWGHFPHTKANRLWNKWLGPIAEVADGGFNRGLPVISIIGTKFLLPKFTALLAGEAFAFVQFVDLLRVGEVRAASLADLPELKYVSGLGLGFIQTIRVSTTARLLSSPHLSGMRCLRLLRLRVSVAARELACNAALGRLRKLELEGCHLSDEGVGFLAEAVHLGRLESLDLRSNQIGDAGAEALAASKTLANLRELDMRFNGSLTDKGKQRLLDAFGDRVQLSFPATR